MNRVIFKITCRLIDQEYKCKLQPKSIHPLIMINRLIMSAVKLIPAHWGDRLREFLGCLYEGVSAGCIIHQLSAV